MSAMIGSSRHPLAIGLASALWLAAGFAPAWAQETDHASHHPEAKPAPAATPSSPEPVDPHAGHQPTPTDTMSDDQGAMDHGSMKHGAAATAGRDHSSMTHSTLETPQEEHPYRQHLR